jgi:hypothetical protein
VFSDEKILLQENSNCTNGSGKDTISEDGNNPYFVKIMLELLRRSVGTQLEKKK